jgi:hypothetical protein
MFLELFPLGYIPGRIASLIQTSEALNADMELKTDALVRGTSKLSILDRLPQKQIPCEVTVDI